VRRSRRDFAQGCLALFTAVATRRALAAAPGERSVARPRVLLTDARDEPLEAGALTVGETYVFHYPYVTTPCFLVDLGEAVVREQELSTRDGERYRWEGGVGPRRSIVAYSAICAHRMTHPSPQVSFIAYRHRGARFLDLKERRVTRPGVIVCCSEHSVYDARAGARVLGGPAPEPLAAILLEHDPRRDALYAVGTRGPVRFERFFREFGFRLSLDYATERVDRPVRERTRVVPLAEYTRNAVAC
jgi:Rieske Fe-S protein